MYAAGSAFPENSRSFARDRQARCSVGVRDDLDIVPCDLASPASFQSLQKCFFCRKSSGVRLSGGVSLTVAVGPFALSEDTLAETGRSGEGVADAINFNNVDTDGDDHSWPV